VISVNVILSHDRDSVQQLKCSRVPCVDEWINLPNGDECVVTQVAHNLTSHGSRTEPAIVATVWADYT
jgi:hypothetical protein